jgi:hypothetical protein
MKNIIANPSWAYSNGTISFSASVQIVTDDYDLTTGTGSIIQGDSISAKRPVGNIDIPGAVTELTRKAQAIIDEFNSNLASVFQQTGATSIDDIVNGLVAAVQGGLK